MNDPEKKEVYEVLNRLIVLMDGLHEDNRSIMKQVKRLGSDVTALASKVEEQEKQIEKLCGKESK